MTPEQTADLTILSRSLRHSLQKENDTWEIDAPYPIGELGSYDYFFEPLLEEEGVSTFQGLLQARKRQGLLAHSLDLFGSGFFIEDLTIPDTITGARLTDTSKKELRLLHEIEKNADSDYERTRSRHAITRIEEMTTSSKWQLIQGNLFSPTTWQSMDSARETQGIDAYDLVVIKPEGALKDREIFHSKDWHGDYDRVQRIYALKFLRLLNRAYTRLSAKNGMLFTEVPGFIAENYLEKFTDTLEAGNIHTGIMDSRYWSRRKNLKLVRRPSSSPNLEQLARHAG